MKNITVIAFLALLAAPVVLTAGQDGDVSRSAVFNAAAAAYGQQAAEVPQPEVPQPVVRKTVSKDFGGTRNVCRDRLLALIGVDAAQPKIEVTRQLVGKVVSKNFPGLNNGVCTVNITYSQPEGKPGSVSFDVANSILFPFNHTVAADNSAESCSGGDPLVVSGSGEYTEPSGWHKHYSTDFKLTRNSDGTLLLTYMQEQSQLVCTGVIK